MSVEITNFIAFCQHNNANSRDSASQALSNAVIDEGSTSPPRTAWLVTIMN